MTRYGSRDDQWERIKDLLRGRVGHAGATALASIDRSGALSLSRRNSLART